MRTLNIMWFYLDRETEILSDSVVTPRACNLQLLYMISINTRWCHIDIIINKSIATLTLVLITHILFKSENTNRRSSCIKIVCFITLYGSTGTCKMQFVTKYNRVTCCLFFFYRCKNNFKRETSSRFSHWLSISWIFF